MKKTSIKRSWGATIGYLAGALVAIVLSILLFWTIAEGPITIGIALIPAVVGVLLVIVSVGGSGTSTCPVCGAQISGLSTKDNDGVICSNCRNYVEGRDGMLWRTDENRIAETPIFTSPLPERFTFPEGCCVCGLRETAREKITLAEQNASSVVTAPTIGVTTSTSLIVEVPHCPAHPGGALLSGTPKSPYIKFRSYPYLRAFCQLNGTIPGYHYENSAAGGSGNTP